jgi:hypothetical protein
MLGRYETELDIISTIILGSHIFHCDSSYCSTGTWVFHLADVKVGPRVRIRVRIRIRIRVRVRVRTRIN